MTATRPQSATTTGSGATASNTVTTKSTVATKNTVHTATTPSAFSTLDRPDPAEAPSASAPGSTTLAGPPPAAAARPAWDDLIEAVRESGQYTTTAEAARVTRVVLSALGGHVTGDERVALARHLPEEAAQLIASEIPVTRPLTAAEFVDTVLARIEGATSATARWDVSSVLSTLPRMVGDTLVDRILAQLPSGYALLFLRPELIRAS